MPYRPVVQKGWEELNIRDNPHGITVVSSVIWFTFHDLSGEIVCSKYRSGELKQNQRKQKHQTKKNKKKKQQQKTNQQAQTKPTWYTTSICALSTGRSSVST